MAYDMPIGIRAYAALHKLGRYCSVNSPNSSQYKTYAIRHNIICGEILVHRLNSDLKPD